MFVSNRPECPKLGQAERVQVNPLVISMIVFYQREEVNESINRPVAPTIKRPLLALSGGQVVCDFCVEP